MTLEAVNPMTGHTIRTYDTMSDGDVDRTIRSAHETFLAWRDVPLDERARLMRAAAAVLRDRREPYARLMTDEMGKTIREARVEIEKCAWVCEHYAEHAATMLAEIEVATDAGRSFVAFRPLGVVLSVMPWNFPFWQVFRFAAPGLMAGNAGLLKHASNVPGCALAIEEVFREAGFPDNLFRTLLIGSGSVGRVLEDPKVVAATLTGSTAAGRAVAAKAGEQLKKTVLELGGSDAYLLLEDADVADAVEACVASRLINAGQSCIAAKRFVVPSALVDEFTHRMVARMAAMTVGNPTDESVDLGPMARVDLRDELHEQVRQSVRAGARCLLGGEVPDGPGAYYPPTVLTGVRPGMPAYDDELFGPVAAIIPVEDELEGIRTANDSVFGLGAAVFTRDTPRGTALATDALDAGSCFVNGLVKSDPRLPFGGIKQSGYGRELAEFGIREFVNIKTVWVR